LSVWVSPTSAVVLTGTRANQLTTLRSALTAPVPLSRSTPARPLAASSLPLARPASSST
jgi:hypothetical protein